MKIMREKEKDISKVILKVTQFKRDIKRIQRINSSKLNSNITRF